MSLRRTGTTSSSHFGSFCLYLGIVSGFCAIVTCEIFALDVSLPGSYMLCMRSCLGLLIVILAFTLVIGGGGLIWYLSDSSEFSRTDVKAPVKP